MPSYAYAVYNNQPQSVAHTQDALDAMANDGWHVHTASLNYTELYVLWEKDGPSARLADASEAQLALAQDSGNGRKKTSPPAPPGDA